MLIGPGCDVGVGQCPDRGLAADPVTLLEKYQQLAATTKDIVSTDIPRSVLDDFVDLGFSVKDAEIRSVVFVETLIDPAYPDYDRMRQIVQDSLTAPAAPSSSAPAPGTSAAPSESVSPAPAQNPVADVGDACAYDPAQAQEALDRGEPPTKNG